MADDKIYPADTVDAAGNVWPTVGENIRNGEQYVDGVFPDSYIKVFVDTFFPVGSVWAGEIPEAFKRVSGWAPLPVNSDLQLIVHTVGRISGTELSDALFNSAKLDDTVGKHPVSLRFFLRAE